MKKEIEIVRLENESGSSFSNRLWNGPWTTIQGIPKKIPHILVSITRH
jgi:hypothetical protein